MFDLSAFFIAQILIYLICFVILLQEWLQNKGRYKGVGFWVITICLTCFGYLLIAFRGKTPDFISVIAGNASILLGLILFVVGLKLFFHERVKPLFNLSILFLSVVALCYFTYFSPDIRARVVVISLATLAISAGIFKLLIKLFKTQMKLNSFSILLSIVLLLALSLFRMLMYAFFARPSQSFFNENWYDKVYFVLNLMIFLYLVLNLTLVISKQLLDEVTSEETKFNTIFYKAPYAVIITRASDAKILEINDELIRLLGFTKKELLGNCMIQLNTSLNLVKRAEHIESVKTGGQIDSVEIDLQKKSGETAHVLHSAVLIKLEGEEALLSTFKDITELYNLKKELERMALRDPLTNLPNRRAFYDFFESQKQRVQGTKERLTAVMFDLDDFKSVNDRYGHDIGDKVLSTIAKKIRSVSGSKDIIARFGGDEFVMLLCGLEEKSDYQSALSRYKSIFDTPLEIDGEHYQVNISFGAALYPDNGDNCQALLKKADDALMEVKKATKNAIRFSDQ